MIIASYNVENMFNRPRAFFDYETGKEHPEVVEAYVELIKLLERESYDGVKDDILKRLRDLGLERAKESKFAVLREIKGDLLKRPQKPKPVEVIADGRSSWIGWVELKTNEIKAQATQNIAAVVANIKPDVLAVVEAEDRIVLERFNEYVLKKVTKAAGQPWQFKYAMLIDGRDERGIDVGLLTKEDFPISSIRSHVNDEKDGKWIFSRDCAEYEVPTSDGGSLLLMINHFKSKIGGGGDKRALQAERVAEIYEERRKEGWKRIIIAGDFNDTPDSDSLKPLLGETELKDAGTHEKFNWGERTGTYDSTNNQFDYLLLSPALFKAVKGGGVNREGVWHSQGTRNPWKMLPTLKDEIEAASDHAAVWVELGI